jgi:tetraacyldisaccharide 4'-kinase
MPKLKQWYIGFLDKDKRNIFESFFACVLYLLSLVYGLGVFFRNFLYDKHILTINTTKSKVISVGNLSWSGSGKTTLALFLYNKFCERFQTAILRRGYGSDEEKLLKEVTANVFSAVDRAALAKKFESRFGLFILDDGFQYRRLKRDVEIVVMGAREFKDKHHLIPADFFREPLNSLKRADFLILNYKDELNDPLKTIAPIRRIAPDLKIFFLVIK